MDENSCVLCGGHAVPTGSNEAMDGPVCPACLSKLSPLFTELDTAETSELQAQLQGRERNRAAVQDFRPSRKFGSSPLLLVDDSARRFLLTPTRNYRSGNPDVISMDQVLDCVCHVDEEKEDLGNKQARYSYIFRITITLEDSHPYLPDCEFSFNLNDRPLVREGAKGGFLGRGAYDPEEDPEYQALGAQADRLCRLLTGDEEPGENAGLDLVAPGEFDAAPAAPAADSPVPQAPSAPQAAAVSCPWCGSTVSPTPEGTCPLCDGPLS